MVNENNLPLSEPVFQILSEIFDEYTPEEKTAPGGIQNIPEDKPNYQKNSKTDLNTFLDSYPYESWDSPGSVESDILFPELSV